MAIGSCALVCTLPGEAQAHADAKAPAVALSARVATPLVPGGAVANVAVGVVNKTETATAAGVRTSLTVAIPSGFSWDGATILEGARVVCRATAATATCATSARLPAHAAFELLLRFRVGGEAKGSRTFRVSGAGTVAGQTKRAAIRIGGKLSPIAVVSVGGTLGARPDRASVATFDVLNAGTGPASAVELSGVLPVAVIGSWRAAGRGWICTGASGTAPRCALATAVPAGTIAPRLTITYRLDPAKVAALHLVPGSLPATQRWQVSTVARSDNGSVSGSAPGEIDILPPPAATIVATARAAHNLQELLPGTKTSVLVDLRNTGGAATKGLTTLSGKVPPQLMVTGVSSAKATWTCAPSADTFNCQTSATIAPARTLRAVIRVEARTDALPGTGVLAVAAVATNTNPALKPRASSLPFEILEADKGFPSIVVLRAGRKGSLARVLDGSPAQLLSGQQLTERLDVRNAGGAEIAAGSRIVLTQTFTRGSTIRSINAPAGWRCSGTSALSCTYLTSGSLRPAATTEGPTVTVTAGAATSGERAWLAQVVLDPAGKTKALRAPVLVEITRGVASLVANLTTLKAPTAGGAGSFALVVRNTGNIATGGRVTAGVHLPRGVHVAGASGSGWSCTPAPSRTTLSCTSSSALPAGGHLKRISLSASFSRATGGRSLSLGARAGATATSAASGSLSVIPRHALTAKISRHVSEVTDLEPLVGVNEKPIQTLVTLEADGSGGSGAAVHYRWRQVCATSSCPRVTWVTSAGEADVKIAIPRVTQRTLLSFQVTVGDGSANASATTSLRVVPLASASSGLSFRSPHPRGERPETVSVKKTPLPPAAVPLKKKAKPAAKASARVASAAPSAAVTTADTTTTTETTTTEPTTTTGPETTTGETTTTEPVPTAPAIFCGLVRRAASSSFDASLAGVSLALKNVKRSAKLCEEDTVIHFSGSKFSIHGYLHGNDLSGTITADGVEFDGGTLTGPEAWHLPELSLTHAFKLSFSDTGASLDGSVSAEGDVPFLPLTSRWHGTTKLSFSDGSNGPAVSLATDAAGPRSEASPASPLPALTIAGRIGNDGTFALALKVAQLVQVRGHGVDVSGHITRASSDGELSWSAAGDAAESFDVLPALDVDALHVTFKPTEGSLGIAGHGVFGMSGFGGRLKLPFTFHYADPEDYSLVAEQVSSDAWEVLPGMTVGADSFHGSVVAKNDHINLAISANVAHWTPASGVAVSNLSLAIAGGCPNTAVSCIKNATAYIAVKGDVAFTLPKGGGTLQSHLEGTIVPDFAPTKGKPTTKAPGGKFSSLPGIQAFRLVASFPHGFGLGGGVTIDRPSLVLQVGMPVPPEEPMPVNTTGRFLVDITGGVTIPGVGTSPIVHAYFNQDGWAIAAPIGTFSVPGASGDGTKLVDAVVGWSTFPAEMEVFDRSTQAPTIIDLPGNVFKLTGDYTAPGWTKRLLGQTSDVKGRATGLINPVAGTYGLRMHLAIATTPYIYGNSTSATNVRLTGGFFEITRTDSLFSLTLGGLAKLSVGGGNGLTPSEIDLTAALTLDSAGTVIGRLSFDKTGGWVNAFGVDDLTLHKLTFQFAFKQSAPAPDFGLTADAVLPSAARSALGQADFARTLVVAQLSVQNPCLGVQVSDPAKSGRNVMSIGNGAVTAKSFDLWFAPRGCTVGAITYKAGASLKFDGAVGGIPLQLEATVGFKPFTFDGFVDLAETPLGGITVKRTRITAKLAPSLLHVTFSGGIDIFGTNVDVSGRIEQRGRNTVFDLTGTLDKLEIGGDMLTARDLRVTFFNSTGEQQTTSVRATGSIKVLTATVDGTVAFAQIDGKLAGAKADLAAKVTVGGSNGLALDGLFKLDYEPGSKTSGVPKLDAVVTASALGARLSETKVVIQNGFIQLSSIYTYGSVFTAFIEGAAYYGRLPAGATSLKPDGTRVPAATGDFFIAAQNVSLKLGPFNATGKVWLGHVQGTIKAEVAASMQMTGGPANNTALIQGSLDGNTGNLDLVGTANLDLIGYTQNVAVTVVHRPNVFKASGEATMSVLGSAVSFKGDFLYNAGAFRFRLAARANLNVGGYSIVGAFVTLSNFPDDAGLLAQIDVSAGGAAKISGLLSIDANGRFLLRVSSSVNLKVLTTSATLTFANLESQCTYTLVAFRSFTDIEWSKSCKDVPTQPYFEAAARVNVPKFNNIGFDVTVRLRANGSFAATVRTPGSGWTSIETPNLGTWPVDGRARLQYYVELRLDSAAALPIDVFAGGEAEILYQYWTPLSWSSWKTAASVRLEVRGINPFHGCAWISIIGYDVGGCI